MATEILDGTIDPAEPRRNKRGYMYFDQLRFRDKAGKERMLPKICAGGEVATVLRKGGEGRFYLTKWGGQNGIFGVRMKDGARAYAHYNNMELIFWIGIVAGAIMGVIYLMGIEGRMITPVIIGAALAVAMIFFRKHKSSSKADYDRDSTPR